MLKSLSSSDLRSTLNARILLTIIKSNWGNIFGGYTSNSWKSPSSFEYGPQDSNAFIYLVKSHEKAIQSECPIFMDIISGNVSMGYVADFGPRFGVNDICIYDKCNKADWLK